MKKEIIEIIYKSISELNKQLDYDSQLEKSTNTILMGSNSQLDSLGLVNLIIAVEQNIEKNFDTTITLADEKALSQKQSPFLTIGSLVDYIVSLIKEKN